MATKRKTSRVLVSDQLAPGPSSGITLTAGALADLRYLEPTRTRNRLISIMEELYSRIERLERMHRDEGH